MENSWFPLNNLVIFEWIFFKFIWYMTGNKTQVEFEKGGYMLLFFMYILIKCMMCAMMANGIVLVLIYVTDFVEGIK